MRFGFRGKQSRSCRREGYLAGVVAAARVVASGGSTVPELVERVRVQIADILDLDGCRFDPEPAGTGARLHRDGSLTWKGHDVDVEHDGLPTMDEIDLPVEHSGVSHGRYVLVAATATRRPDLEQRLVAITLAEQVGAAISARNTGAPTRVDDAR